MKMSKSEILHFSKKFLSENYNMELSIPIEINSRLITTLGRFIVDTRESRPIKIELSKKFLIGGTRKDIIETVIHECVHYALYKLKKPYRDGDEYFENELKKHGADSSNIVDYKIERNARVYTCKCKEHIFFATIRPSYCKKCGENLIYLERRKMLV